MSSVSSLPTSSSIVTPTKSVVKLWSHIPGFIANADAVFAILYQQLYPLMIKNNSRYSCSFNKTINNNNNYNNIPCYNFITNETLLNILNTIENTMNVKFDYCLCHLYIDGNSSISWHNDKEALNTSVLSLSLGETRKFRFRLIGQTSGYVEEISLKSGDLVLMYPNCQQYYQHCIPKELKVSKPRINLTFRNYDY
jgi:hypothetical protein